MGPEVHCGFEEAGGSARSPTCLSPPGHGHDLVRPSQGSECDGLDFEMPFGDWGIQNDEPNVVILEGIRHNSAEIDPRPRGG